MDTTRRTLLASAMLALAFSLGGATLLPGNAAAQGHDSGGHDSGGHDSGGHDSGASGHRGPDPNCAFQDRSGRGKRYGPQARRGRGGQGGHDSGGHDSGGGDSGGHDTHSSKGDHQGGGVHTAGATTGNTVTDPGSGVTGGGSGGESYVCDGPGAWTVENKVLSR